MATRRIVRGKCPRKEFLDAFGRGWGLAAILEALFSVHNIEPVDSRHNGTLLTLSRIHLFKKPRPKAMQQMRRTENLTPYVQ